jgi:hypothetical protein
MCHNCASRALRLLPMPRSLEGIRERLLRDRRARDRRAGQRDHRIFARERRAAERRVAREPLEAIEWIDDDCILEVIETGGLDLSGSELGEVAPANDAGEAGQADLTRIHELPCAAGERVPRGAPVLPEAAAGNKPA